MPQHLTLSRCFTLKLLPAGSWDFYEGIMSSCFTEREKTLCRGTGAALDVVITLLVHHILWSKEDDAEADVHNTDLFVLPPAPDRELANLSLILSSGLEMTSGPLITSFPASISLSCLVSRWLCVSPLPYPSVCTAEKQLQRWKHCSQMLLTEQGGEKRAAEHLPRQKQLRAALSKCHSENHVKKCHLNPLEMTPVTMGV